MIDSLLVKEDLKNIFKELGIKQGMILEVHSSLSKLGYIAGGATTFNDALIETLGYNGTLLMPLQSASNSEPSKFKHPPLAFELFQKFRDNAPAFDKNNTDSEYMGRAVENLRRREKACISNHPNCAFVSLGKYARLLCEEEPLDFPLGEKSCLAKLYNLKAYCLLAGVDFDVMTSLHLAEYRSNIRDIVLDGAAIQDGINTKWQKFLNIDLNCDDGFKEIGQRLLDKKLAKKKGPFILVRVDLAIDEGIKYYKERL